MSDRATATAGMSAADLNPRKHSYASPVRTSGARPPLFCVFPGPPGSHEFVEMLPWDQPTYDFYFSKLDDNSAFPSAEQFAVDFLEGVRKVQARGPYQLCGYSNAGLVAYEMARLLASQGEKVSLLALIDTWHPEFVRNLPLQELARYRLMRFVNRLQKYGQILSQGRFNEFAAGLFEFVDKRSKSIAWRIAGSSFETANRPAPQGLKVIEQIFSLQTFSPKPYGERFMLIRPDDPVDRKLKDKTVGWHVCAISGIDVHFIPAEHGHMMKRPHVRAVVDRIVPLLASAAASDQR